MPSPKSALAHTLDPDERQQQAIEHVHGPMLVLAGAGTGKTTVLIRRIARLIAEGHARPDEILALTYTDNAAQEMRQRVRLELKGTDIPGLQATTFHAYCNNLLIRSGKQFGVLDDKDLWIFLRKRIRELHLHYFVRAANITEFLEDLLNFMRRCHDELVGPEQYADYVRRLERGELRVQRVTKSKDAGTLTEEEVHERCREIASVFKTVEDMLQQRNLGTFGHMITRAYRLLEQDEALVAREQATARFILVDEFQDANFAQIKILGLLAGRERNLFAVGDPDQAIYRFRGASSAAFGLFQRHFPGAKVVVLEKNRRSTTAILKCAFAVIDKNPPVFPAGHAACLSYKRSPLHSVRDSESKMQGRETPQVPVETVLWTHRELESSDLGNSILQKQRRLRCAWKDFAVLYRNHANRDEAVRELAQRNIPFSIENMDVFDTPEVRDLLGCLGAIVSQADSASIFRVAALPQFAIDPEKLRAAMRSATKDSTLGFVLEGLANGPAVLQALDNLRREIRDKNLKSRAALELIIRHLALDRTSPALIAVLDFVEAWEKKPVTVSGEIGELLEYLEYFREAKGAIPLASVDHDAVRLMTAHNAKGLEFNHVYIIRASSPTFPCSYREPLVEFPHELRDPDSVAQDEGKALSDQEECRLFYVAMTRARDSLTIYAKQGAGKDTTPPGFLRDLLKDSAVGACLRRRAAKAFQVDLFAGEELVPIARSTAAAWLSVSTGVNLDSNLSATAVEVYETCPLRFKLERDWRMPRAVPAAMHYGAAMHRVLRTYYDAVRFKRKIGDGELIEIFRADLAGTAIEDHYQHELYERQGMAQLQGFLECARRADSPEVLHTEQVFTMRIGKATVAGRIDRIDRLSDGSVAVVDYKTGKPRSQKDADESLQLSIYALAAREHFGYRADRLVFYNLEDNSSVDTSRTDLQLEEAKLKVEEVAAEISAGKFPAKTGFHCFLCPYRNLCPATEKYLPFSGAKKAASRAN